MHSIFCSFAGVEMVAMGHPPFPGHDPARSFNYQKPSLSSDDVNGEGGVPADSFMLASLQK